MPGDFYSPSHSRGRILASAAALALVASGALGAMDLAHSGAARAAPVDLSNLPAPSTPSFATLVDRVKPAVVSVKVTLQNVASLSGSTGEFDKLPPEIQQFLKRFGLPNDNQATPRSPDVMAQGSGFFISADGYIVTNNHVVQNARTVTVTMNDGKILDAKVVGTDAKTDLALLKVDQKGDYPFVSFAKTTPQVGDWVLAIGNPYGLGGTVTAGIVSADGRDIGAGPYDRFMQIDAPINKGNSGGPTFNLKGEVVGVNTAIFSPSGGSVGIGFAIPAATADLVVDALEHGGVVTRGFLGVMVQPIDADAAKALGLATAQGALVDQATPGTPAAQAGLQSGDVITRLNGETVKDAADLTRRLGALKPGDKITLTYLRNGVEKTAEAALASQTAKQAAKAEPEPAPDQGTAALGLTLAPAQDVAGAGDAGVAVVKVDPNGAAAAKGIKAGDVILDVSGKAASTPDDVKAEVAAARQSGKQAVLMRVKSPEGARYVAFALPKA